MTRDEKKAAIDSAWARYREASTAIPRTHPYAGHKRNGVYRDGFLEIDERLWRQYLATERAIQNAPETKAD